MSRRWALGQLAYVLVNARRAYRNETAAASVFAPARSE
jgi:hypothetical protein